MPEIIRECNICEEIRTLTEDHVPPNACKNNGVLHYYRVFENLVPNEYGKIRTKPWKVQNGKKYKSICSKCNNERLGKQCDPTIKDFIDNIEQQLASISTTEDLISVDVDINKLVRGIIGHFLASLSVYIKESPVENNLRAYFMKDKLEALKGYKLYFWIYPHDSIVVERNFGIYGNSILHNSVSSIMKFSPVAFLLTESHIDIQAINLLDFLSNSNGDIKRIEFKLNDMLEMVMLREDWPNIVCDDYVFIKSPEVMKDSYWTLPK